MVVGVLKCFISTSTHPVGGLFDCSRGSAVSVLSVKVELFQTRRAADLKLSNGRSLCQTLPQLHYIQYIIYCTHIIISFKINPSLTSLVEKTLVCPKS